MAEKYPNGATLSDSDAKRWEAIDKSNTEWLKQIVKEYGWPGTSLVGEDGAAAAFLLVQHADYDVEFQELCLEMLRTAVEIGEPFAQQLGFLTDRVRVHHKQPQIYGTQMTFTNGVYGPAPIEDEKNVDKRRAAIGLEPLAEYVKKMKANN